MNGRNPQREENEDQPDLFGPSWPTMKTPSHLGHEHTKRVELRNANDLGGCINAEIWCPVCDEQIGTQSVRTDL